jgi:hypothetical protein
MTGQDGLISPTLLPPSTPGTTVLLETNSTPNAIQTILNLKQGANITLTADAFGGVTIDASGSVSASFTGITSGDNTTANMTVDTGATLSYANSGTVNANEIGTINVALNLPTHPGEVLISQPGNVTAVWADPLVQGLYAVGSFINSPPSYAAPTTIQPVLIGGSDYNGGTPALWNLKVDSGGNIYIGGSVAVTGTVAISNFPASQPVTGTFWQATQPVSGSVSISNFPATPFTFTNYGSPAVEAANVYVVNPISVSFPSSLAVTQDTSPWVVSGTVDVSNFPSTQAVTGTFWQATQPVSGTFWQATQPVSGSVSVSNFPASQAVTGTFWQATQPVSLASTAITGTVAVTGAFFQATQPVSGTVAVSNFPATPFTFTNYGSPAVEAANVYVVNPLSVTFTESTIGVTQNTSPWVVSGTVSVSNFPASQAVTGTFWQAVQPVSFTTPFSIDLHDGFGNAINSSSYGSPAVNALDVYVVNSTSSSVTQGTSPWITADEHITKNLNQDSGGNVGVNVENTVPVTGTFWQASQPVSNAALSEMMFTPYGSPPCTALSVYVVNPLTVTFTESTIGVTQSTSPWVVSLASTSITGTVAVTGTFYQATQPVSGTVSVSNFPASQTVNGTVSVANLSFTNYGSPAQEGLNVYVLNPLSVTFTESTIGVTQSTSPWVVSGTVSVSNFPASQAVTGTFWQATQPVSGTFWQATQPVSGTVAISNTTIAVTNAGTFPVQAQDISPANAATSQVAVSMSATVIAIARPTRNSVKITNLSTTPVYLGFTSGVTVSTGDYLPGIVGSFVVYPVQTGVWGIAATGSSPPSEFVAVADAWY